MALTPQRESVGKIVADRIREAKERGEPFLDLSALGIEELPAELRELPHLRRLDLSQNLLTALTGAISPLMELQTLDLSNNKLVELPYSIGRFSKLRFLNVSSNNLTCLPTSIGDLAELRELCLFQNHLESLPEEIGELTQLGTLYINYNRLTGLPGSIVRLIALQKLDLSHNAELFSLPTGLRQLSLSELYLHENGKLNIPNEILGPDFRAVHEHRQIPAVPGDILDYYFREKSPLNEAKLILVGRGGVGKTSLVRRLLHGKFDPVQAQTQGIEINTWRVTLDRGDNVQLHVWDFGGQEILHATHQFFLTERSLYLLVLSGREGTAEADAEYWLRMISSFGADSPVIVVLNKDHEFPCDVNRRALLAKYPKISTFIKTDCKDGTGIDDLIRAVSKETARLENVAVGFPKDWFAIKDALTATERNYITFDEFRIFCEERGEANPANQDVLAGFLHVLGIVLHYTDDVLLRGHYVLSPHWVTRGVYQILTAPLLADRKGVLESSDVPKLLDVKTYPPEMHDFLLGLMKKFELCFNFLDEEKKYLVPELLEKQEPDGVVAFLQNCLGFRYEYLVLPEGLLPRFIVRTHALSEGEPRWRLGVILRFEGSRALVKADAIERQVQISVIGSGSEGRKRLLSVIRSHLEEIHKRISGLNPQELVAVSHLPEVFVPYRKLKVLREAGQQTIQEVYDEKLYDLSVADLIDSVDFEGSGGSRAGQDRYAGPAHVLCSFATPDERFRDALETHLHILRRRGLIDKWTYREIDPDDAANDPIRWRVEEANIILLLISPDFVASAYVSSGELRRALERHLDGNARVIPIIVREVDWSDTLFGRLKPLPKGGKPVTQWGDPDSAWHNVSEGIEQAIEVIRRGGLSKRTLRVSSVRVRNIRCIGQLDLDFTGDSLPASFSLIIGKNGVGKSTLLRCIALGLCHETEAAALVGRLKGELLRVGEKTGSIVLRLVDPESGRIWTVRTKVLASDTDSPPTLRRRYRPDDFPPEAAFVCGYGAGRRGVGVGDPPASYKIQNAVLSLFDYHAPLQNPELTLRRLAKGSLHLKQILLKFDAALSLPMGSTTVDSNGIRIRGLWGNFVPVGALSDGYQSILAWMVDFLGSQALFDSECPLEDVSGIILLDELEQHLHPQWQREIIGQLANVFPKVQFIMTSHSPICAVGLEDISEGDARLFALDTDDAESAVKVVVTSAPVPVGMSYDQIMTSEAFGLPLARAKSTEAKLEEVRLAFEDPDYPLGKSPRFREAMGQLRIWSAPAADDEHLRLTQRRLNVELKALKEMPALGDTSRVDNYDQNHAAHESSSIARDEERQTDRGENQGDR